MSDNGKELESNATLFEENYDQSALQSQKKLKKVDTNRIRIPQATLSPSAVASHRRAKEQDRAESNQYELGKHGHTFEKQIDQNLVDNKAEAKTNIEKLCINKSQSVER